MMGARELLPVFFSYCRRMLRAFLLVALGGATLFVVTILYRAVAGHVKSKFCS